MDKYYYLVAQLPVLHFDREPALSMQDFLEETEKWLPPRKMRFLKAVSAFPEKNIPGPRTWRRYQAKEQAFRADLARWRRARKQGNDYKTTFPQSLVREGNPLEIEKKCLYWRWNLIEALEEGHDFDLDILVLYLLKLHILRKLVVFDREKGMERFRALRDRRVPGIDEEDESMGGGEPDLSAGYEQTESDQDK
ncbi:MAG TPA: DUF2764 family protein [bacterium]|nr:DUF2764 family protein [bacterium]